METKKINWANDFQINESLHTLSQEMSAAYGRMSFNNKNHSDAKQWQEQSIKWMDYERTIKDLVFNTEGEANAEVNRLGEECKQVLTLEKTLLDPRKQQE